MADSSISIASEIVNSNNGLLDDGNSIASQILAEQKRRAAIEGKLAEDQNQRIPADLQAKALPIAKENGIPVDTARRNLGVLEKEKLAKDIDAVKTEAPSYAKLIVDGDHGPIAKEAVSELPYFERVLRSYRQAFAGGMEDLEISDIGFKMRENAASEADIARLKELKEARKKRADYQIGAVGEFFQYPVQSAPATAATFARTWDEILLGAGTGAATAFVAGQLGPQVALPEELVTVPAGAIAGARIGARVGLVKESYQQLAGDAYVEALDVLDENGNPLDSDTAYAVSTFAGGVGAVAELLPFEKALDTMPFLKGAVGREGARRLASYAANNPAVRASLSRIGRVLKVGGAEAFTEVLQEATVLEGLIAAGGVFDSDGNVLADQRGERYSGAAVGGFAGGSTLGAAGEILTAGVQTVSSYSQKRAELKRQSLVDLGDRIRKSRVNGISPETIVAHAKQIDADEAGPQMSAPVGAIVSLFQSEGLTPEQVQTEFPDIARAINEAAESDAEVPLNAEAVVKLARLNGFANITGDIRMAPEELTANEEKEQSAELNNLIANVSAEDEKVAVRASIENEVTKQLVAAGTDPRAAATMAKVHASTITNLAERSGMDADALLKRFPLKITGDQQTDMTAVDPNTTMFQRDVLARTPELQDGIRKLQAGEITREQFSALVDRYKPVAPYAEVPLPATTEEMQAALTEDKVPKVGAPDQLQEGHPVGLRLDIPAYARHGTWVVSVHDQKPGFAAGPSIGYSSVARATNVELGVVQNAAANIAGGKPKATIAVMKGAWKQTTPEQAKADADAALKDPAWRQIGMDPERHAYFYDRETMQPITNAEEVIQIGPLVLGKNVTYGDTSTFLFQSEQEPAADATPAGGLTDKGLITVDALRDAVVIPIFADLTDAGRVYNKLDGLPLTPTRYFGGPNFPWLKQYRDAGIVWAFNKQQVITKLRNHVRNIREKAKAEGRPNQRVVITVLAMKDDAHTSNEMTINALLRTLDAVVAAGRFPQNVLDEAKAFIVGQHKKKEDGYKELKTFPGFDDAKALHSWIRGATFPGRKALAKEMQSAKFEQFPGMFPVSRVIREAVDPDYRATQVGDALLAFEIDPDDEKLIVDFEDKSSGVERHPSYRYGMRGKLLGSFKTHIPMEVLYKDLLPKVVARSNPGSAPKFLMERLSNGGKLSAKGTGEKAVFKLPMNNVTDQTLSVTGVRKDKATGEEVPVDLGPFTVAEETYTSKDGEEKEAFFLKFKTAPPKGVSILATNEPDGQAITPDVIDHANVIEGLHDYRVAQAMTAALAGQWRTNDIDGTKGGVIPVEFERALAENDAAVTLTKYTRDDVKKGKQDGSLRVFQLGAAEVEKGGLSTWFAIKKGYDYRSEYPGAVTEKLVADGVLTDSEVALVGVANNELGVKGMATFQVLKAVEEGVTVLDCFKVKSAEKPFGLLPSIYGTLGFEEVGAIPFDPQYFDDQQLADLKAVWSRQGWNEADGYPDVAIMKYRGSDEVRSEATRRFIAEGQPGLGILDEPLGQFKAARDGISQGTAADDGRGGRAGEGDGRADPGRFQDRAGRLAGEGRAYVRNVLAADKRATDALKLPPDLINRIRERFPDLDQKAPSPGPSSSEGMTLYQSDLSFYDPSLKPLIKARDVKAAAIRTVDQLVQIADGMKSWRDWYDRYEQVLIDFLGSPEEAQLFQDILSATSQAASVKANVGLAIRAYDSMKSGQPFTGFLPAVIGNLNRIRENQAVQGRKIGQYGEASNGNADAIAVDRHIAMVIFGVKAPSPKQIEQAKDMIREVASQLGWDPREVQAALWAGNQILLGTPEENIGSYDAVLLKKGEPLKQLFRDIQSRNGDVRGTGGSPSEVGAAAGGAGEARAGEGQQRLDQRAQTTQSFARGSIAIAPGRANFQITLTGRADLSTFMHEAGHYYLEVMQALVESGDASPQLVEDMSVIRKWMGLEPDNKMGPPTRLDRVHHEKWARGWEAYLMEGRAPSAELQGAFNRFRAWLVFIYKRLTALNVELTDEVRGVMDRLVASDREISEARTNIGWAKPLPKEALFLSDDEYDRYVEAWNKASQAQQREVDAKLMLEAARETQAAWKQERQQIMDEEKAKLAQTRGHRAWKLLTTGEGLEAAASGRTSLKINPATVPSEWSRDAAGMTDETGLPLDAVAEILGFNSGEQMIQLIAGAKFADRDLPSRVRKIMSERHGDMDMAALADAANEAVHSDDTQEVLLTEFRAMAAKAGIQNVPPGLTKWMAAKAQQRVLGLTRRQLDPMRWRRAEISSAQKSASAKDPSQAAIHKRQQMMASAMYKATTDAQKRVEVIGKKLMPFTKNDRRAKLGKAGEIYLDGIDQILEDIQLKPMSAASIQKLDRLQKLVEEADRNGEPLVLPDKLRAMLGKKNFADMTLEELEGVHDSVMNIWHLAKTKNELKARKEKRDLEQALTEMEANAQAALGDRDVTVKFTEGWKDRAAARMRSFRAGLVKMEFLFGWLDGKPDGGLMHRLIYQPIADANKAKFDILQRFHKTIIERTRSMPAEQKARWESKRTFMGNPTANGATIISAALNLGNAGNRTKLLEGYGWNEQQLMAEINAFMTKADWDFVQHVWDEIDTLWPKIEATTKAATGLAPEKVVPTPIVTPHGTYAGGYYPVVYDPNQTEQQFKNQQESAGLFTNNYARPTLGDGFTKARVDYAAPIKLELSVISQHLAEVVHYVTHYEAVTQADKITRHPRFQALVKGHMGNEFYRTIRPWLQDVARDQDTPAITNQEPFAKAMRHLRGGVSIAAMGYNIFTGVKQLIGVVQSLDAVGPKYWLSGLVKAWASPKAIANWRFAFENSQELKPLVTQLDRDIKMVNDAYARQTAMNMPANVFSWAFKHIGWLQAAVNVATWHGAYEQEIAVSGEHERAVMHADSVVRKTQSAGAVKDLSPIQRGTEINRAISMFYSWFNVLYNRLEDINRETKSIRDVPKAAARVAILVMMSSMIEEAGRRAWEGIVDNYDDDEEEPGYILSVLLKSADTLIGALPLARVFLSPQAATGGLTPDLIPVAGVVDSYWRTLSAARDLVMEGETPSRGEVKAAVRTVSIIGGVPLSGPYNFLDEMFGEAVFNERKKK